jgi:hypothetical protein
MLDLSQIKFIKRITLGSNDPEALRSEAEVEETAALLNRCLTELPAGHILGIEKRFNVLSIGEHQVVLQCLIYHVGFKRRPAWLAS